MAPAPGAADLWPYCSISLAIEEQTICSHAAPVCRGLESVIGMAVADAEERQWLEDAEAEQRRREEQEVASALEELWRLRREAAEWRGQRDHAEKASSSKDTSEETAAPSEHEAVSVASTFSSWRDWRGRVDARSHVDQFLRAEGFASVTQQRRRCCKTCYPLHRAVEERDVLLVKDLLFCRADPTQVDSAGRAPRKRAERLNCKGSHDAILAELPDPTRPVQQASKERRIVRRSVPFEMVPMENLADRLGKAQPGLASTPGGAWLPQPPPERKPQEAKAAWDPAQAQAVAMAQVVKGLHAQAQGMDLQEIDASVAQVLIAEALGARAERSALSRQTSRTCAEEAEEGKSSSFAVFRGGDSPTKSID